MIYTEFKGQDLNMEETRNSNLGKAFNVKVLHSGTAVLVKYCIEVVKNNHIEIEEK